jgi:sec-independent protein translocase protein TatA
VLAIILLLFGAKRISELAKGLGNGVREFKKGTERGDEVDKEGKVENGHSEDADTRNERVS